MAEETAEDVMNSLPVQEPVKEDAAPAPAPVPATASVPAVAAEAGVKELPQLLGPQPGDVAVINGITVTTN